MRIIISTILLLLVTFSGFAQFNDSTHYYVSCKSAGSINRTNANSAYLLNNAFKVSLDRKQFTLNLANSWVYGEQQNKLTNNDFNSTLDCNIYNSLPHFFYWALGNYTASYSLKVIDQYQTGAGLAYNVFDRAKIKINVSDGILYESSDIRLTDSTHDKYTTFRNSLRLSFKLNIHELITFNGVNFLQNSLSSNSDYIIKSNLTLGVKLRKWLSLTTTYSYNRYNRTGRENTLFSYGLTVEKYF